MNAIVSRPVRAMTIAALTSLVPFSTAAAGIGGDTHYWVGGLIDWWDDPTNWSSSSGGPGGFGLPAEGDFVELTAPAGGGFQALYRDPPGGNRTYFLVTVEGTGAGSTGTAQLLVGQGTLRSALGLVKGPHATLTQSGGLVDITGLTLRPGPEGTPGAPSAYNISGGELICASLRIESNADSPITFHQTGGEAYAGSLEISSPTPGHVSEATLDGGNLHVPSMKIGQDSAGRFTMNGGELEGDIHVGRGDSTGAEFVQSEGDVLGGTLYFGANPDTQSGPWTNEQGLARFLDFADAEFDTCIFNGASGGSPNVLRLEDSAFVQISSCDVQSGNARIEVTDGSLDIFDINALAAPLDVVLTGGFTRMEFSSLIALADIHANGGDLVLYGYYGSNSSFVDLTGGSVLIESMNVADMTMSGGSIRPDWTASPPVEYATLTIRDSFQYSGGTIDTRLIFLPQAIDLSAPISFRGGFTTRHPDFQWDTTHAIRADGGWRNEGGASLNGATIDCWTFGTVHNMYPTSVINGPGTLITNHFTNSGLLDLAGGTTLFPTTVDGVCSMSNTARLRAEVNRSGLFTLVTRLNVSDRCACDGQLIVELNSTAAPFQIGDTFTIINAGEVTGRFDLVTLENGDTLPFDARIEYTDTTVSIRLVEPICHGDANGDNAVNFADLELLLENWNTEVEPGTNGDVTYNGTVDFADLNILLDNWENVCS